MHVVVDQVQIENVPHDARSVQQSARIDPSLQDMFATKAGSNVEANQVDNLSPLVQIAGVEGSFIQSSSCDQFSPRTLPDRQGFANTFNRSTEVNKKYGLINSQSKSREAKPPASRAKLFGDLPNHDYLLPTGQLLNFTLAEIIVLLPNWIRNRDIAARFLNNGIDSAVHLAIVEKYRYLKVPSERLRDRINDTYRRAMRLNHPTWSKVSHRTPGGWNVNIIAVNNFLPEVAREPGYVAPPPIPFKDLAYGLKMLPGANDAADLSRAVVFALEDHFDEHDNILEFLFPDHLQLILDHIGRTTITQEQTDPSIISRFREVRQQVAATKYEMTADWRKQEPQNSVREHYMLTVDQQHPEGVLQQFALDNSPPTPAHSQHIITHESDSSDGGMLNPDSALPYALRPSQPFEQMEPVAFTSFDNLRHANLVAQRSRSSDDEFPKIPNMCCMLDLEHENATFQSQEPQPPVKEKDIFTMEDLDAFFAHHHPIDIPGLMPLYPWPELSQVPINSQYLSTHLLRDCVEADDENDHSNLARAARWAQQFVMTDNDFTVGDIDLIVKMLDMMYDHGTQSCSVN